MPRLSRRRGADESPAEQIRHRIALPGSGAERRSSTSNELRLLIDRKIRPKHNEIVDLIREPQELVADATRVTTRNQTQIRRCTQAWQAQALNYYDMIPEIHFASGFYARGLAGLRLYVGVMDDEGEITESKDPAEIDLIARVKDRAGGRETLLADYGKLAFTAGESFLLWTQEDNGEVWEVVSTDELRVDQGKNTYYRIASPSISPEELLVAPDDAFEPLPGECIAYRMWTPHPRFSRWADSPMRACLDLCEELVLLTLVVRARVMSRLAGNGILLIPDEMSPAADAETDEEPGDEDIRSDPFVADLIESTVAPIETPGTAAAQVPLVVRGPMAALEAIRHLTFRDVEEEYRETGLRDECIRRIATGLDMPPEALLGMSGANHWNAWIIDEQTWKVHLKPIATQFCGNLTEAYLRPTARDAGLPNADRLVVMFDAASVVVNPDRGNDAKDAYAARIIGKAAYREVLGFSDDDAPTAEDLEEMLFVATGQPSVESEGVDESIATKDSDADAEERDPQGEDTPREEPDEDESQVASAAADFHILSLTGAAQLAVIRCRSIAGSRLLAKLQGEGEIAPEIKAARKDQVAWIAGPAFGPGGVLVEDGAQEFVSLAIQWGVDPEKAATLGDLVELHAGRTLFEEEPLDLPSTFTAALAKL